MNYRHIYHAGNFADVFKHCILVLLLESLLRKEKPFCYIDTHAGLGVYDLQSEPAQKTLEYLHGISQVLNCAYANTPKEIIPYFAAIKKLNKPFENKELTGNSIKFYPGSPFIAHSMLRSYDRMVLMELHQEDVLALKRIFVKNKQIAVHHYDGYHGLKAFLPPREKRGLVLIDPSFEQTNEFARVLSALECALSRWQNGIYAVWYPIKDITLVNNFLRILDKMGIQYLTCEMTIGKQTLLKKFVGCGMVIVNPPWQIEKALEKTLPWLRKILSSYHAF
jgi:23S rRNA (adenine2030-N6)-methyltransferase